jgi:hypothetical protein
VESPLRCEVRRNGPGVIRELRPGPTRRPIRAQVGPPRYILPVQGMGAWFPEKRMIRHSLADWMMCRLTVKATPQPEDLRLGAAPWQPKRQPQRFGVAWIPGFARFKPSKRCLLRH